MHHNLGRCVTSIGALCRWPPIISPTMLDWDEICDTLLGITPVKGESIVGSMIKLKWLTDNLLPIDENFSIEVIHAMI